MSAFERFLRFLVTQEVGSDFGRSFLPLSAKKFDEANARHSVSELFPYRDFDQDRGLYMNRDGVGFALLCSPSTGLAEEELRTLEQIFNSTYKPDTIIQVIMIADPNVKPILDNWRDGRTSGGVNKKVSAANQEMFERLAEQRVEYLNNASWKSLFNEETVMVRDFHLIVTLSLPMQEGQERFTRGELDELERQREAIAGALRSAKIGTELLRPEMLINLLGNMLRPQLQEGEAPRLPMPYIPGHPINQQVAPNETSLFVQRDSLLLKWRDNFVSVLPFSVKQYPIEWMGSANGELLGGFFNRIQRISCPFILTLNVHFPEQMGAATNARNKMLRATQMRDTEVGKYVPQWKDRHRDWDYVVKRIDQGAALLRVNYQAILFAPLGKEQECEQSLKNVFSAAGWVMVKDRFNVLPRVLSSLPLWIGREGFSLMKKLRFFGTMLSWNAVNIAPWIAEWKGNVPSGKKPMLLFVGRRGQLCYLDPFLNEKGNYNCAVAATSGAGKSFFTQDYANAILGSGGRLFIIDSGGSYLNLCNLLDGEYITFDTGNKIVLNPFSSIIEDDGGVGFSEQLPMLTELLATMASPQEPLPAKHKALLSHAIMMSWNSFGAESTITTVKKGLQKSPHEEGQDLAVMLSPYCEDGAYAEYFEGKANIEFNNPFVVLELDALKAKGDLQTVVVFILMKRISEAMYLSGRAQRKLCIIDEAWRLLGNGSAGTFIEEGYRTARKYGGAFMTITQDLGDYFSSKPSMAAYKNSDFVFLLRQKEDALASVKKNDYLVMNPFEERVYKSITTFGGRYSEIAIKSPDGLAVGQLIVDRFSSKLMSTKPDDVEAIKSFERQGLSKWEAIKRVAGT